MEFWKKLSRHCNFEKIYPDIGILKDWNWTPHIENYDFSEAARRKLPHRKQSRSDSASTGTFVINPAEVAAGHGIFSFDSFEAKKQTGWMRFDWGFGGKNPAVLQFSFCMHCKAHSSADFTLNVSKVPMSVLATYGLTRYNGVPVQSENYFQFIKNSESFFNSRRKGL